MTDKLLLTRELRASLVPVLKVGSIIRQNYSKFSGFEREHIAIILSDIYKAADMLERQVILMAEDGDKLETIHDDELEELKREAM